MVHFVIAGNPDCKNMVQVMNAVYYLKKNLPNFEYRKLELRTDEWDEYLVKTNRQYKWHHAESPMIYKENYAYGAPHPTLIGGISEFWEYCYDYYGLESIIDAGDVENLISDNLRNFNKNYYDSYNESQGSLNIMIYGATNPMTTILLPEFMDMEGVGNFSKVNFILYDEALDFNNSNYFNEFIEEFKGMFGTKMEYCDNLGEGLKDTHLLIFIDDTSNMEDDALRTYLCQIFYLAEEINLLGRRDLRIIFANNGICCLIATILARKVQIPHSQIVVVTSDLGLGYLGEMSRRLNIGIEKLGAPPVWGFVGLNEFVDTGSGLMKCKVCKPYKRAIFATPNSTLVHGTTQYELRFINYLSDDIKDLKEIVNNRRKVVKEKLARAPMFAKLEGLVNLVKIWYGCSSLKQPIISLGVMSDGSYNIRKRLVFSQPAIQFRNGWVPYGSYPVPDHILTAVVAAGIEADAHYMIYSNISQYNRDDIVQRHAMAAVSSKYKSTASRRPSHAMLTRI